MKIAYVPKTFSAEHRSVIDAANDLIAEYEGKGYELTLRQLYYQFVARAIIPNNDRSYKRLGGIIDDARMAGEIDWDAIKDRTRFLRRSSVWDGPAGIIDSCVDSFAIDHWKGQRKRIEVWVEKDALVGVVEAECRPLQVPFLSCRGYTSASEMWGAGMRLVRMVEAGLDPVILHLGDHDPSGIDMSRDIQDRLNLFVRHHVGGDFSLEFERLALNMPQVEAFSPPPNPAKLTDSRCRGYIEKFGDESWELDAMPPDDLADLIRTSVERHAVKSKIDGRKKEEKKHRQLLERCRDRWDDVQELLGASQ